MNRRETAKLGIAVLLGVLYGLLNTLTLGLRLPGSAAVIAVRPQIVIPLLGGFLMGPVHGFLVGFGGNLLADWLTGFGFVYWPFSIANGLIGALPGFLHTRGMRRVDSVSQFSQLLLAIVAGNIFGVGLGMILFKMAAADSVQHLTWAFFHPIIVSNVILGFVLMPPLLFLFRRMSATFDIRLCVSLMYLLMMVVIAVILLLNAMNGRALHAELAGLMPEEQLAKHCEMMALNNFRYGGSLGIAAILASVGAAFLLIRHLARPISSLTRAADQLKEGRFDEVRLESLTRRQDGFGRLARVLDEAVAQVRTREESLRQALRELRLEINREQEERQVNEITETEYFRSLRHRSLELRARKDRHGHEKEQDQQRAE